MPNTVRSTVFSRDKQAFFSHNSSMQHAKKLAKDKNYSFLANNRLLIENEFNQLFAALQKEGRDRSEFWLYCYYCCVMLKQYYAAYDNKAQFKKYRKQAKQIKYRCNTGSFEEPKMSEERFLDSLQRQIGNDLGVLASTPMHISKIRDWLSFTNIYRIHFVFCRLAVMQSLIVVEELHWLTQLAEKLGMNIDIQGMVSVIKAPTAVFNVLSVGLFAARFIINAGMLLKHTFAPTAEESSLAKKERFTLELKKRYCDFINDIVWGTINGLTNYSSYFNIAAPVANGLLAGFLFFDVALLTYRRHLVKQDYLTKKEQYILERDRYLLLMNTLQLGSEDSRRYAKHCRVLEEQLTQLEINWQAASATYLFNVAAAALLMGGFSVSLLLAAMPAAVLVCYLVGVIAVAMYLTGDIYGKYKEKTLILEQACKDRSDTSAMSTEAADAKSDFIMAMFKNTVTPIIIVATFAACWQAAVVLVAVYIGYECLRGYFNNPEAPAPKALDTHEEPGIEHDMLPTTMACS